MCVLTEDDEHAHPGRARERALRIPELNDNTDCAYLHRQWK
jgi:hypothetical protein